MDLAGDGRDAAAGREYGGLSSAARLTYLSYGTGARNLDRPAAGLALARSPTTARLGSDVLCRRSTPGHHHVGA
jgi:hypothetical protein